MARYWFYLAIIQLTARTVLILAANPGMISRITPSGFNFLRDVGVQKAQEMARGHYIPGQSGGSGALSYSVWNMQVTNLAIPYCRIYTRPSNLLGVTLSDINLSLTGSFKYSYSFLFWGDGEFSATVSDVSISLHMFIGIDERGRPRVKSYTDDCQFNAENVNINLYGQWGWISGKASSSLKEYLNTNACTDITGAINSQLEQHLMELTMLSKIYDGLELDYSLLSVTIPSATTPSFDVRHKGEVYAVGHHSEAPGNITSIPIDSDESSMFYVWITDYLVNSVGYVLHNNSYLNYNITKKDVPAGSKFSLNTSGLPLSYVFPQVRKLYPNKMTQFHISSTKQPIVNTTSKKITLNIYGNVDAYVINENNTLEYLFTLGAEIRASFRIVMKNQNVTWVSTFERVQLDVVKSAIGDVRIGMLKRFLPVVAKTYINKMGAVGKPVPSFQDYHPMNTNITQGKGFLKIGTDLSFYNPIEETLADLFRRLPNLLRYFFQLA